ncbi:hypothetical protein NQ317_012543 [Molorchus minor]|uniref:Uncharacterized protein n=1 Tax=Molorchus minor TaxID=1323400 RepID=A0ABQ9K397_9CUCU|nr:hypothetical protein NQ317_012543 [Molorchus minor]
MVQMIKENGKLGYIKMKSIINSFQCSGLIHQPLKEVLKFYSETVQMYWKFYPGSQPIFKYIVINYLKVLPKNQEQNFLLFVYLIMI